VIRALACGLILLAFTCGAVGAAPAVPNGPLTLDQAVARVREAGFDVRIAASDAAITRADEGTARSLIAPQVSVSGTALSANDSQLGMPVARQLYASANFTLPIFAPAPKLAVRAAQLKSQASATAIDVARVDAVFATVQAYRRAQLAQAILAARHAAVADQQLHLHVTELKVDAGKAASYLLARDRAALAGALQMQEDAASEHDQAVNDLKALLDIAPDAALNVAEPLTIATFSPTVDMMRRRALAQAPRLLEARTEVAAAQASVQSARAAFLPSASLVAQSYNGTSSPSLGSAGGQIGFTATVPIIDGGAHAAAVARAGAEVARAQAVLERSVAGVERDVADAWRELQASQRNIATAQAAQADADEQLRVTRLRESAGKAIELEVLDALAVDAAARESVLRSVARYDNAVAAVHRAAGDQTP
jgi:outer membrane protein, multidrug efflux system